MVTELPMRANCGGKTAKMSKHGGRTAGAGKRRRKTHKNSKINPAHPCLSKVVFYIIL